MKFKNYRCKRISRKHFDTIRVSGAFLQHKPGRAKWLDKTVAFMARKELSPIIVDENYILVDGYCSWLLAKRHEYRGHKLKIYMAEGLAIDTHGCVISAKTFNSIYNEINA